MSLDIERQVISPEMLVDEKPKTDPEDAGCTDFKDTTVISVDLKEPLSQPEKLNQDDLETPPSPATLQNPPPSYSQSQWDENLNRIIQVLDGHSEYLANATAVKDASMLEKMTQLESLVQSLQVTLSNQTFAMHDLRTQLSDIQNVLKKMENKQDSITTDELMKQVATIKTLTESLKHRLDENNIPAQASEEPVVNHVPKQEDSQPEGESSVTIDDGTLNVAAPVNGNTQAMPSPVPMSRTTSRQSRPPSRGGSRTTSRPVSPTRPPIPRSSSKLKLDVPDIPGSPSITPQKLRTAIEPINELEDKNEGDDENKGDEADDEDDDLSKDESFARMADILSSLINEATTAVEAPVKGREKKFRQFSNASIESRDILEDFDWDALAEDNDDEGEEEDSEKGAQTKALVATAKEREKPKKEHKRQKSKKEEEFEDSMRTLDSTMQAFMADLTGSVIEEDNGAVVSRDKNGIIRELTVNYADDTQDLINNPSGDLADLDDFAQQCRLLTRALILPFLHATHSFMKDSLEVSSNPNAPKTLTSTTRTFMNLMYWTFLFTLGSLVLDAWLCEVAGRQVIRMVDMLKPTQPFGLLNNSYSSYNSGYNNAQQYDYIQSRPDVGRLEDGKKKNVNFRTGPRMRNVGWRGMGLGVGSGKRWLRESAKSVIQLGRRSGRFLAGGAWGDNVFDRTSHWDEADDDLYSDSGEEWEIVDWFDSSTEEEDDDDNETDTVADESSSTEDSAVELRRLITKERLRRAGHVVFTSTSALSPADQQDCTSVATTEAEVTTNPIENEPTEHSSESSEAQGNFICHKSCAPPKVLSIDTAREPVGEVVRDELLSPISPASAYLCNDDDTLDLPIPGSFPAEFRWTPTSPTFDFTDSNNEESTRTRRRRVRSVIVHRPKRSGEGELWLVKAKKVKSASRSKRNSVVDASALTASLHKKSASPSSMSKRKKRPSLSFPRTWERRNSI